MIIPLTSEACFWICVIFLNNLSADIRPTVRNSPKIITGKAVPRPKSAGARMFDFILIAMGISPPKKSAAETGQKLRAKINPREKDDNKPDFFDHFSIPVETPKLRKFNFIRPTRNIPTSTRMGPKAIFMILWRRKDRLDISERPSITKDPVRV